MSDWLSVSGILRKQSWIEQLEQCGATCEAIRRIVEADQSKHLVKFVLQSTCETMGVVSTVFAALYETSNGKASRSQRHSQHNTHKNTTTRKSLWRAGVD
jgi:hypothetical protein